MFNKILQDIKSLKIQGAENVAKAAIKALRDVTLKNSDKNEYEHLLIRTIEKEFEHNLAQQIYMSDECWNIIKAAKNATIQAIRKAAMSESDSSDKLREDILNSTMDKQSPSATALSYVKKEISSLW